MTIQNNWAKDAACKDSDLDFHSRKPTDIEAAKALCNECPVRKMCVQSALDNYEHFGVWGGADETEYRRNLAINAKGESHVSTQGKIRCTFCGPLSTRYIKVVGTHRTKTDLECTNCGTTWSPRKVINRRGTNW